MFNLQKGRFFISVSCPLREGHAPLGVGVRSRDGGLQVNLGLLALSISIGRTPLFDDPIEDDELEDIALLVDEEDRFLVASPEEQYAMHH